MRSPLSNDETSRDMLDEILDRDNYHLMILVAEMKCQYHDSFTHPFYERYFLFSKADWSTNEISFEIPKNIADQDVSYIYKEKKKLKRTELSCYEFVRLRLTFTLKTVPIILHKMFIVYTFILLIYQLMRNLKERYFQWSSLFILLLKFIHLLFF